MKSISKAMIAVVVAAAMCVVPLFVIEDAEAVTLTDGESGVSFKASSMSNDDFNNLVTDNYKDELANMLIQLVVADSGSGEFNFNEVPTITDVKDIKLANGMKIDGDKITTVGSSAIKCKIAFKVTYDGKELGVPIYTGQLFENIDGNQTLLKEGVDPLITDGDTIEFNGTFTLELSARSESTMAKNGNDNYIATEVVIKNSMMRAFDGTVKFNNGTAIKTIELDTKNATSQNVTYVLDYGDVKTSEAVAGTKVIMSPKDLSGATEINYNYTISEKKGGYEYKLGADSHGPGQFFSMTVADLPGYAAVLSGLLECKIILYVDENLKVPEFKYYIADDMSLNKCLFNMGMVKTAYQDDTELGKFLGDKGDASETSFSDAKSVTDAAYTSISADGSSGGSNVIFYVIIGVLAVAVVALAVLMIKKK